MAFCPVLPLRASSLRYTPARGQGAQLRPHCPRGLLGSVLMLSFIFLLLPPYAPFMVFTSIHLFVEWFMCPSSPLRFQNMETFLQHVIIRPSGHEHRLWGLDFLGVSPDSILASWVTSGKLLYFPVSPTPQLQNGGTGLR